MKFEHLIQINDPNNPLVAPLSRHHVWQGLLQRVEDPLPFLPGLEACNILERQGNELRRALDFGSAVIEDRVTVAEMDWVRFDIVPSPTYPGGSLTISIEEPEPAALFLRFAYQTTLASNPDSEDQAYIEYVKAAYHQSDLDCVRIIRTLAAGGTPQ